MTAAAVETTLLKLAAAAKERLILMWLTALVGRRSCSVL
jgi:hypothetical protein